MTKRESTRPKVKAKERTPLTGVQFARLRGETLLSEDTIRRWATGKKVQPANQDRLERAAAKLGVKLEGATT